MSEQPVDGATCHTRGTLRSRSFVGLLLTQFFGALNDNMFRWLVVPIAQPAVGSDNALAIGLACFTVPYLMLATPAGFLADRFRKSSVIVACKIAEILIMALGIVAISTGSVGLLFVVVALMGSQSALFGPSKFGAMPEMLRERHVSSANGWMGMITVAASALGTVLGYWMYGQTTPDLSNPPGLGGLWLPAAALVGVACLGTLTSLLIARLPVANSEREAALNPVTDTIRNLGLLGKDVRLVRTALGIGFFWFLASLAQLNIDSFGENVLGLIKSDIGALLAILVVGLGIGSVLAGIWSGGRVELGIVPLGALGIATSALLLYVVGHAVELDPSQQGYYWACLFLFALGASAGLFNVPLVAYLQVESDAKTRGTILAASNFVTFTFILGAAGVYWFASGPLEMTASEVFLVAGLGTIPVVIYVFSLLPDATIRFATWLMSHTVYRLRVYDRERIPETGGALIVPNHVSWIDGILLLITSTRPIRMLVFDDYTRGRFASWIVKTFGIIPVKSSAGPKEILRSLQTARKAVQNGELVCIFAEGQITRTGQMQPFQRGMMKVIQGTDAPVIPTYLDELWGSIFSFHGGKFFWKRPRRWPYPVSIHFGEPIRNPQSVDEIQHAVEKLGAEAVERRKDRELMPQRLFLRACRKHASDLKLADSGGQELSGRRLLTSTLAFARVLEREVFDADEKNVGLLLPPSAGGIIANVAVALSRRVAVNLNYTMTDETVNFCIKECGVTHVLTSRRFIEKKPMSLDAELIYLEDLKEQITTADKLLSVLRATVVPIGVLERRLGLLRISEDDPMAVIFTSGSTGNPKGVVLSHNNVRSNVAAAEQLFHFTRDDVMLGVLPLFHSFGYTLTTWIPMCGAPLGVYHFNPLDGRTVGKLSGKYNVTAICASPTFLKGYLKRCTSEQMQKLSLMILGAEKMPLKLAQECEEKFGVWPVEGYGTTELSPLASANVPDSRSTDASQTGSKVGTVGRAIPNVVAKITDPDTGADLGRNAEGMLWIKGPNVMLGYLNQPEKTAEAIQDGWYNTGDIGIIDEDGFISITGRQSRFSKIGGEMVPHIRIEEEIAKLVEDADADEPEIQVAVTAVPDERKGERLIIIHKPLKVPISEIQEGLKGAGFPNIWIPSADGFLEVESIPLLGTGKLDLKGVKETAESAFGKA